MHGTLMEVCVKEVTGPLEMPPREVCRCRKRQLSWLLASVMALLRVLGGAKSGGCPQGGNWRLGDCNSPQINTLAVRNAGKWE